MLALDLTGTTVAKTILGLTVTILRIRLGFGLLEKPLPSFRIAIGFGPGIVPCIWINGELHVGRVDRFQCFDHFL